MHYTKHFVLALAATAILAVASPRAAQACATGFDIPVGVVAYAFGTPVLNLGLGIYDLAADKPSKAYGVTEILLTAPQVLIGGYYTYTLLGDDTSTTTSIAAVYLALPTTLLVHGIVVASRPERAPPPPNVVSIGSVKALILPTMVSDGVNIAPGLGVAARF